ncbi:amidohydrolase [Amycolatopsis sp. Poz14]|uniref:amidohydrolase family protein n=1 Tax=Amycolatopsis sp. Poz14 TaxID=1447705 RepID=UPI001EE99B61|nr:amidohydrolase family protein [Amycolatopsis sp. Poz14]MCG3753968.1 amidohydrolase [Amycolatopsis sp. Poz14]
MIITDSQVHIWELSRPGREWPSGRFVPPWAQDALSAEHLLDRMRAAGVDRAILVPPAFEGDRNDLSLDAARRYPDRFAVMGRMRLDDSATPAKLASWAETPGAIGLRFTFFIPQQKAWLSDGTADWLWSAAEEAGIPLMVYPAPSVLPLFGPIAAAHPRLKLTVDHLGVGHEEWNRDDRAFGHLDALLELAGHPNVAVKASGLPEYSTERYPYRNLHPYLKAVVDAYGARRVFWGTDLTRLPCTYREAVTMFTEQLDWLSATDLEWIMGRAVSEWHAWPGAR